MTYEQICETLILVFLAGAAGCLWATASTNKNYWRAVERICFQGAFLLAFWFAAFLYHIAGK